MSLNALAVKIFYVVWRNIDFLMQRSDSFLRNSSDYYGNRIKTKECKIFVCLISCGYLHLCFDRMQCHFIRDFIVLTDFNGVGNVTKGKCVVFHALKLVIFVSSAIGVEYLASDWCS
jgi:hypothetical protein